MQSSAGYHIGEGMSWAYHCGLHASATIACMSHHMHPPSLIAACCAGVANSIKSDIDNLVNMLSVFNVFPKGMYIDEIVKFAKEELALECDYEHEASCQEEYRERLQQSTALRDTFVAPAVQRELTSSKVLTGEWMAGVPIDQIKDQPQDVRDRVGHALMHLVLQVRLHLVSYNPG